MEYSEKDFEGMMFPVNRIDDNADILKTFPGLSIYPEFKHTSKLIEAGIHPTKLFKYIVFAYDSKSPLVRDVSIAVTKRKALALRLAGFIVVDEQYDDNIIDIITCNNEYVAWQVVRYCKMHHNMIYEDLMSRNDAHYNENFFLKTETDATKRSSCIKNLQTLKKEIEELTNEFLASDNNNFLKNELFAEIEYDQLGISPEERAERKMKGINPNGNYNPYV